MENDTDSSGRGRNPKNETTARQGHADPRWRHSGIQSSLMSLGLIDKVRLMVNPFMLGGGKLLSKDVKERHVLKFIRAVPLKSGKVGLTYSTQS
jgi:hypothetical protein